MARDFYGDEIDPPAPDFSGMREVPNPAGPSARIEKFSALVEQAIGKGGKAWAHVRGVGAVQVNGILFDEETGLILMPINDGGGDQLLWCEPWALTAVRTLDWEEPA